MDQDRRRSLIAGVLFLLTFATSIPGALLYGPVLSDPHYVLGSGATGPVLAGALCEIALVIANLGTTLGTIDSLSGLLSKETLTAFALLGVLSLAPIVVKRFRSRR